MKIASRVIEKILHLGILVTILLGSEIQTSFAQPSAVESAQESQLRNAGRHIRLVSNLDLKARAVPLPQTINSPYSEGIPITDPTGTRLYFSRAFAPGNVAGVNDEGDIWHADRDSETGDWTEPIRMSSLFNNAGPNAVIGMGVSGDTILLGCNYDDRKECKQGVSYSVRTGNQWSTPTSIHIRNDYNRSTQRSTSVTIGNGVVISALERSDTFGDKDLYVSFWDGVTASKPVNMGAVLNSKFGEATPYLDRDNLTLYFASKGHQGYGGYDIFVSHRLDDSWLNWSDPENMGPAINGKLDDQAFLITDDGQMIFLSKQVTVHNTDLYMIAMKDMFAHKGFR